MTKEKKTTENKTGQGEMNKTPKVKFVDIRDTSFNELRPMEPGKLNRAALQRSKVKLIAERHVKRVKTTLHSLMISTDLVIVAGSVHSNTKDANRRQVKDPNHITLYVTDRCTMHVYVDDNLNDTACLVFIRPEDSKAMKLCQALDYGDVDFFYNEQRREEIKRLKPGYFEPSKEQEQAVKEGAVPYKSLAIHWLTENGDLMPREEGELRPTGTDLRQFREEQEIKEAERRRREEDQRRRVERERRHKERDGSLSRQEKVGRLTPVPFDEESGDESRSKYRTRSKSPSEAKKKAKSRSPSPVWRI